MALLTHRLFRPIAIVSTIAVAIFVGTWFSTDHDYMGVPGPDGVIPLHIVRYLDGIKFVFESIDRDPQNQTIRLRGKLYNKTSILSQLQAFATGKGRDLPIHGYFEADPSFTSTSGVFGFETSSSSAPTSGSEIDWAIYSFEFAPSSLSMFRIETPNPPYSSGQKIRWSHPDKTQEGEGIQLSLDSIQNLGPPSDFHFPPLPPPRFYDRLRDLFDFHPRPVLLPGTYTTIIRFTLKTPTPLPTGEEWVVNDIQVLDRLGGYVSGTSDDSPRNGSISTFTESTLDPADGPFRLEVPVGHEKWFTPDELTNLTMPKPGESVAIKKTYIVGKEQVTLLGVYGAGVHLKKPDIQITSPSAVFVTSNGVKSIEINQNYGDASVDLSNNGENITGIKTMIFALFPAPKLKVSFLVLSDQQTFTFDVQPDFIK